MIEINIAKKLQSSAGEMWLDVQQRIARGSFTTIYGPSGVGKTSLLRMLAGLFSPDRGKIVVNGTTWVDTEMGINVVPQKRNAGIVFQDYALFHNMTVRSNLEFALKKGQDSRIVGDLMEIMALHELQHRKPETLSGGQQQRVALARALVQMPEILMLDEPLSALDVEMRSHLQDYILQLHRRYGLTTILISHEIAEILKMSDRVLVMDQGKIINQGLPEVIFTNNKVSGKFQFTGVVMAMERQDFIFIITLLIGKDLVRVIAEENEAKSLKVGDKVLVASKAFNPIIRKID